MLREFKSFLIKQNALALAIGVIIGAALNAVVQSIVADLIMPIVGLISPGDAGWQTWVTPGPVPLKVGSFLAAVLNFLIIGFVAWQITKWIIKPPEPGEKPSTKPCGFCRMEIDPAATRCPHCTSQLGAAQAA